MSDQDFFFDEEEKPAAPAKGGTTGAKRPVKATASAAPAAGVPFFEQSVSMMVATLAAVCALLLGVIAGYAVKPAAVNVPATSGTGGGVAAPQLTEEQLGSGQLPAGHPDIGELQGGASSAATGTTGTK